MGKDYKNNECKQNGCSNNYNKNNNESNIKKSNEDYYFYIGLVNRVSDYDATSKFITNHMKNTCVRGNDMSEAFRTCAKPNMKNLGSSLKLSDSTVTT